MILKFLFIFAIYFNKWNCYLPARSNPCLMYIIQEAIMIYFSMFLRNCFRNHSLIHLCLAPSLRVFTNRFPSTLFGKHWSRMISLFHFLLVISWQDELKIVLTFRQRLLFTRFQVLSHGRSNVTKFASGKQHYTISYIDDHCAPLFFFIHISDYFSPTHHW